MVQHESTFEVRASSFTGPIPPPTVLQHYNDILPGAADRIMAMAESNAKHRQQLEAKVVDANCRAQSRGQILAFALAMTVIISGSVLMFLGHEAKGFTMVVGAATSLIGAFVWGRSRQERERRQKLAALPVLQSATPRAKP